MDCVSREFLLRKRSKMMLKNQQRLCRVIFLIREYLQLKFSNGARIPAEYNEMIIVLEQLLPESVARFPQTNPPNTSAGEAGELIVMCIRNLIAKGGIDETTIMRFNWVDMFDPDLSDISVNSPHAAPDLAPD